MSSFGGSLASKLLASTASSSFPKAAATYTSSDGGIIVPHAALDRWFAYKATGCTTPRDVVCYGDSTMFGSGGLYSIITRLRERATAAGLPDGGKGIFAGLEDQIVYDAPEVNGIVSNGFQDSADIYDTLVGSFLYDDGTPANAQVTFRFRTTSVRLWYIKRNGASTFTYAVNGGSTTTVDAHQTGTPEPSYIVISGLAANTTHTLQVVNTGGGECHVACAPINASGPRFQKQAISGATFANFFFAGTMTAPYTQSLESFRYQAPLGLTNTLVASSASYRGAPVNTTHPSGERLAPVLGMTNLGFNDLTNTPGAGELAAWSEYVKRFAGGCYDAGIDGVVIAGQLPYNANWPTYGAARFAALRDTALACGLAFVDSFLPVGGPSLSYAGGTSNPHLTKVQYQAQGDYLWDGLLGL